MDTNGIVASAQEIISLNNTDGAVFWAVKILANGRHKYIDTAADLFDISFFFFTTKCILWWKMAYDKSCKLIDTICNIH